VQWPGRTYSPAHHSLPSPAFPFFSFFGCGLPCCISCYFAAFLPKKGNKLRLCSFSCCRLNRLLSTIVAVLRFPIIHIRVHLCPSVVCLPSTAIFRLRRPESTAKANALGQGKVGRVIDRHRLAAHVIFPDAHLNQIICFCLRQLWFRQ
jgi:hypothetical protein